MNKSKSRKKIKSRELNLEGELTIQRAAELKEIFLQSIENTDQLVINLENATDFDLSFIQLLYSANQTLKQLNKSLTLSSNYPEYLLQSVKEAGFTCLIGDLINIEQHYDEG